LLEHKNRQSNGALILKNNTKEWLGFGLRWRALGERGLPRQPFKKSANQKARKKRGNVREKFKL
jgi:hypothetical protein